VSECCEEVEHGRGLWRYGGLGSCEDFVSERSL